MTDILIRRAGEDTDVYTHRKYTMSMHGEGSPLQAKGRGPRQNEICQHLGLGCLAPRTMKTWISIA